MIRDGHAGRLRVMAVVDGYGVVELGGLRTREEAEAAEEQALRIEAAGPDCAAVFADRWLEEFPRQSPRSNKQMAYMIRSFVREFGHLDLGDVSPRAARGWAVRERSAARFARTLYEEILELRGGDVRGDGSLLRIERQLANDGSITDLKNTHARTVAILPQARRYLPAIRADVRLFPVSRPMMGYYWRRARTAAGCTDLVFHSLRHYCASWLLDLGASPLDIALQLGHRDGGRLVQQLYGHPDDAIARDRLRRIAGDSTD
jgi:integrase